MLVAGPDTRVVELRVHGLMGTTPETLVSPVAAVDVAGDGIGRIVQPADRLLRPAPGPMLRAEGQSIPRVVEGYIWGGMTSGGAAKAAWALLFPFSLANVAHWMLPPIPSGHRLARAARRGQPLAAAAGRRAADDAAGHPGRGGEPGPDRRALPHARLVVPGPHGAGLAARGLPGAPAHRAGAGAVADLRAVPDLLRGLGDRGAPQPAADAAERAGAAAGDQPGRPTRTRRRCARCTCWPRSRRWRCCRSADPSTRPPARSPCRGRSRWRCWCWPSPACW